MKKRYLQLLSHRGLARLNGYHRLMAIMGGFPGSPESEVNAMNGNGSTGCTMSSPMSTTCICSDGNSGRATNKKAKKRFQTRGGECPINTIGHTKNTSKRRCPEYRNCCSRS
eukprot:GHVU01134245.1.p1 GENE.GHVU01134245.1~~GHVU01134245.1.p1  ORF type:complete len:112 (+),score=1.41 GHVU01134245.1:1528-1863(+)